MSNTNKIEWVNGRPNEGYAGRVRVRISERVPKASWQIDAEALVQIPGTSCLRPSRQILRDAAPTEEGARATAVLLVARVLADMEVAA